MAVQAEAQRFEGWAAFMRTIPAGSVYTITKTDLRAAYDALDQFFSDNAAAINNALPAAAKAGLTTPEKARLLITVTRDRYINGA